MQFVDLRIPLWYGGSMTDTSKLANNTGAMCQPDTTQQKLEVFEEAGHSPAVARAIADIDIVMQRLRRNLSKREFAADVLRSIDPELDLTHLDAIGAICNWHAAVADGEEVTVGLVAERLHIDPSRASRLVSEVVDKGFSRRVASQGDARRICLELTEAGSALADEFRKRKWRMLSAAMSTWPEADILAFARLLDRFSDWTRDGRAALKPVSGHTGKTD
jgi:DNA-binding MarR family transcriptional regulator